MRLQLTLEHRPNQVLPINYQYLISSWIYRTLGNANAAYATKLHEHGYNFRGKKYKLFTFGSLRPKWYDINKRARTFILTKSPTTLELSFYVDEAVKHFVIGLFKDQQFSLSSGRFKANFEIKHIDLLEKPAFKNTMRFRLTTPMCISRNIEGERYAHYCSPEEEGYPELLLNNLLRKQQSLVTQAVGVDESSVDLSFPFDFHLLSKPKPKLYTIKEIEVKGYLFDFELTAPMDLMALGYFGAFGEKNSNYGMGQVEVMKNGRTFKNAENKIKV